MNCTLPNNDAINKDNLKVKSNKINNESFSKKEKRLPPKAVERLTKKFKGIAQ
ncbi:MAG: hypothetical protein LBH25_10070 [Fibromonadaceae bacterium]|nr:hypothetical protein [Fibromonadaceae bacterium]